MVSAILFLAECVFFIFLFSFLAQKKKKATSSAVLISVVTTIKLSPPPRWLATTEPTPPPRCLAVFSAVFLGAVSSKLPLSILQRSVQR